MGLLGLILLQSIQIKAASLSILAIDLRCEGENIGVGLLTNILMLNLVLRDSENHHLLCF
jgi:hypothetical protein